MSSINLVTTCENASQFLLQVQGAEPTVYTNRTGGPIVLTFCLQDRNKYLHTLLETERRSAISIVQFARQNKFAHIIGAYNLWSVAENSNCLSGEYALYAS